MIELDDIGYSEERDGILRNDRGIGFQEIVECILEGHLLDIIKHPSKKYPHQHIMIVNVEGYAYAVPCILKDARVFLKTLYASRYYTKLYLDGEQP